MLIPGLREMDLNTRIMKSDLDFSTGARVLFLSGCSRMIVTLNLLRSLWECCACVLHLSSLFVERSWKGQHSVATRRLSLRVRRHPDRYGLAVDTEDFVPPPSHLLSMFSFLTAKEAKSRGESCNNPLYDGT